MPEPTRPAVSKTEHFWQASLMPVPLPRDDFWVSGTDPQDHRLSVLAHILESFQVCLLLMEVRCGFSVQRCLGLPGPVPKDLEIPPSFQCLRQEATGSVVCVSFKLFASSVLKWSFSSITDDPVFWGKGFC